MYANSLKNTWVIFEICYWNHRALWGFFLMKFCSHRTFGEVTCPFKQKPRPNSIHRRIQMWGAKCKSRADSRSPQQLLEDWQSPWNATGQATATGQIPKTSAPRTGAGSANLFVAPTRESGKRYSIKGNHSKNLAAVLQYKQKRSLNIFIRSVFLGRFCLREC